MKDEALSMVRSLHKMFTENRLTLALAESCTGGLISHYMTLMPGSSAFFQAGLVTYSNSSKLSLLGIAPATIETYGVVSDFAAREMADKVRLLMKTDYALATTGNLGPDVLEGKDMGLVYIAVSSRQRTVSKELRLSGDRMSNKEEAAFLAVKFLFEAAGGGI